jgi:hypothetical protein
LEVLAALAQVMALGEQLHSHWCFSFCWLLSCEPDFSKSHFVPHHAQVAWCVFSFQAIRVSLPPLGRTDDHGHTLYKLDYAQSLVFSGSCKTSAETEQDAAD